MPAPRRFAALGVLAGALLGGCGGGDEAGPARPVTPLDLATTGTVRGVVRLAGDPPPTTTVRMSSAAECAAQYPESDVPAGDVLVRSGLVENAFVYIKDGLGDRVFAVPTEPVVIDNSGCLYRPRVAGAQVGQPIRFVNEDPLLHNIHGTARVAASWNFSLARRGADRVIHVNRPEAMISLRCDVHPWMKGFLGVVDHPYFQVTGPDGQFSFGGVPPGDYRVAVWHERFGSRETRVRVTPRETTEVAFSFGAS